MPTSKLQIAVGEILDKAFPWCNIKENCRPDWLLSSNLTRLELDFYIQELGVALEIQGMQHYEYIPFFHKSLADFKNQKQYDNEKRDLCYGAGIRLIEICTLMDALLAIKSLEEEIDIAERNKARTPDFDAPFVADVNERRIEKYRHDQKRLIKKGEPVASQEQKLQEIKKVYKKFFKYLARSDGKQQTIPYFQFEYLNYIEQCALLEEFNLLSQVYPETRPQENDIEWQRAKEMAQAPLLARLQSNNHPNLERESTQRDDLIKWRKKAIKYIERGKMAAYSFESKYIDKSLSATIQKRLNNVTSKDEIQQIFSKYID